MGSSIFSIGLTGLNAAQAGLVTTSHNISNAGTAGYSRQNTVQSTNPAMFTGAGFYGRGVKVATVTRSTNEFLIKENNLNVSASAADKTRLDKLTQLEKALPTGEAGLGYSASQVLNAFVDVANQPQDMSARQVVLARAQEWVSRVNTSANQLDQLQAGVLSDMQSTVSQINQLTSQIASINQNIAAFSGIGHAPNDLLDQRDQIIRDINPLPD